MNKYQNRNKQISLITMRSDNTYCRYCHMELDLQDFKIENLKPPPKLILLAMEINNEIQFN